MRERALRLREADASPGEAAVGPAPREPLASGPECGDDGREAPHASGGRRQDARDPAVREGDRDAAECEEGGFEQREREPRHRPQVAAGPRDRGDPEGRSGNVAEPRRTPGALAHRGEQHARECRVGEEPPARRGEGECEEHAADHGERERLREREGGEVRPTARRRKRCGAATDPGGRTTAVADAGPAFADAPPDVPPGAVDPSPCGRTSDSGTGTVPPVRPPRRRRCRGAPRPSPAARSGRGRRRRRSGSGRAGR